jgi:hypothetical protein
VKHPQSEKPPTYKQYLALSHPKAIQLCRKGDQRVDEWSLINHQFGFSKQILSSSNASEFPGKPLVGEE